MGEQSTQADDPGRRSIVGTAARWLGMLAATAFVGLLAYGVTAQAPDRTIDDAFARAEAVEAPGFDLEVLDQGRVPGALRPVMDLRRGAGVRFRCSRGGEQLLTREGS